MEGEKQMNYAIIGAIIVTGLIAELLMLDKIYRDKEEKEENNDP